MNSKEIRQGLESEKSQAFLKANYSQLQEVNQKAVVLSIVQNSESIKDKVKNSDRAIAKWLFEKFIDNPFGSPHREDSVRNKRDNDETWCLINNRWSKEKFLQLFLLCGTGIEESKDYLLDLGYDQERERVFDFIHYEELIYHFCICDKKKSINDAYRLISELKSIVNATKCQENMDTCAAINQNTEFREFTRTYIEDNGLGNEKTEDELQKNVEKHACFFHECSNTAWINLIRILKDPKNSLAIKESGSLKIIDDSVLDTFDINNEKSVGKLEALNIRNLVSVLFEVCEKYDNEAFSQSEKNDSTINKADRAYCQFSKDVKEQLYQIKKIDRELFINCLLLTGHIGIQEINSKLGDSGFESLNWTQKQDALVYEACMRLKNANQKLPTSEKKITAFTYYCENIQTFSNWGNINNDN